MKRHIENFTLRLSILSELFQFLWQNKLWWSIPLVLLIVIVLTLIIFGQATGIGPFIYPLF